MKERFKISFLLVFCLMTFHLRDMSAQTNIDSLQHLIDDSKGIQKAKQLNVLASVYLDFDLDKAIATATMAHQLAERLNEPGEQAKATRTIADVYFYKNDLYKAIEFYKLSAEAEKTANSPLSRYFVARIGDIGYCYSALSQFDNAELYYNKALDIARQINDTEEIATNLNNLGQVYCAWGEYDKAISSFTGALELDEERQIEEYISVDLNNIGKVYFSWKKFDKAIEYYNEALEKAVSLSNEPMQAIRLSNIGQAYEALGEYDLALDFLEKALAIDQSHGNKTKVGIRLSHIGMVNMKQEKYATARQNLNASLEIFEEMGIAHSQAITLNHLGDLVAQQKEYNQALAYYNRSLDISREIGLRAQELRSLLGISEAHQQLGNYSAALINYKHYALLNDSIFDEEKHRQVAEFEARYETEKKEKENALLKQEAKIQRNQKTIFIISGFGILLVAMLFIFLFNTKRKSLIQNKKLHEKENRLHGLEMEKQEKEKDHLQKVLFAEEQINKLQQEKLQQKNRELSTSTLHILNKNEVLGNIRKMAEQAVADINQDKNACFANLIHEIDSNTNLDEQWDQFKLHFESVHKGFFTKLTRDFPNLTQNELKLCAYLRMNLSTKEIAQMLHISTESVTTKRYRLRKKLKLDNEENLVGFIGKF
jgi:tetratricopeptide (TPR) repeat protein/DNA-binding CsgD family transcriptional regulator